LSGGYFGPRGALLRDGVNCRADYARFSEPFYRSRLGAVFDFDDMGARPCHANGCSAAV
jgi:hypothetical protein